MDKQPMSPAEFDAKLRDLERNSGGWLSRTSGLRAVGHNKLVGGNPKSKHLLGMAQDYVIEPTCGLTRGHFTVLVGSFGFWWKPIGEWSFHVQGLPPGDIPDWWREKYGPDELPWETE